MKGYTNSVNTIKNYSTGKKNTKQNKLEPEHAKYASEQITTNKQLRPEMFVRNTVSAMGIQNNTECRSHQRRGRAQSTSVRNNKSVHP